MNQINPGKLLRSKWTAVNPTLKEKHFMVVELEFDEEGSVVFCLLEAVTSKRTSPIQWQDLKNTDHWRHGWK